VRGVKPIIGSQSLRRCPLPLPTKIRKGRNLLSFDHSGNEQHRLSKLDAAVDDYASLGASDPEAPNRPRLAGKKIQRGLGLFSVLASAAKSATICAKGSTTKPKRDCRWYEVLATTLLFGNYRITGIQRNTPTWWTSKSPLLSKRLSWLRNWIFRAW